MEIKNKLVKNYLNSFKTLNYSHFVIDLFSFLLLAGLFFGYFSYLNKLSSSFFDGKNLNQIQTLFLSMSPDKMQLFASDLKKFVLFFFIGLISLIILFILIFTYSRIKIWIGLMRLKMSKKMVKKFVQFSFLSGSLLILMFFILLLLQSLLVVAALKVSSTQWVGDLVKYLSSFLILFFLVDWSFSAKHVLFKHGLVWSSIPESFSLLKKNMNRFLPVYLLQMVTFFVVVLVLNLILTQLLGLSEIALFIVRAIVFISLYTWSRNYFYHSVIVRK